MTRVCREVRQPLVQVRRGDRAEPRPQPVPALRAGRASTSTPTTACPTAATAYGYDVQGDNHRTSAYAQDQWTPAAPTLNIGLRLDSIRGYSPILKKDVYTPKTAWGPRIGLAYDLGGNDNGRRAGFFGRYYEGAASAFYTPGDARHLGLHLHAGRREWQCRRSGRSARARADLRHRQRSSTTRVPTEFNVSYEQQLMHGMRLTATGIWRKGGDFLNSVIADARWSPTTLVNPLTEPVDHGIQLGQHRRSNESFIIRNSKASSISIRTGT